MPGFKFCCAGPEIGIFTYIFSFFLIFFHFFYCIISAAYLIL